MNQPSSPTIPPAQRPRKFTDEQVKRLHDASLQILERTGAVLYDQDAIDLLAKAGVPVQDGNRVHIPPKLVEWALSVAPKRVVLHDRAGKPVMYLEGYNTYYGPGLGLSQHHRSPERGAASRTAEWTLTMRCVSAMRCQISISSCPFASRRTSTRSPTTGTRCARCSPTASNRFCS